MTSRPVSRRPVWGICSPAPWPHHYAQPRTTRVIDIVLAVYLSDLEKLLQLLGEDFNYREEAACDVIHNGSLIKIDFMIRKREEYRQVEFERRQRIKVSGSSLWIVSKEDLILSKLDWARQSQSERQLSDV